MNAVDIMDCVSVVFRVSTFGIFLPQRGAFVSEPAILVKRKKRSGQIWTMEKLENKIIDMRDMYEERKTQGLPMMVEDPSDEMVDDSTWVCVSPAWLTPSVSALCARGGVEQLNSAVR